MGKLFDFGVVRRLKAPEFLQSDPKKFILNSAHVDWLPCFGFEKAEHTRISSYHPVMDVFVGQGW
jgi:hypothetical protein